MKKYNLIVIGAGSGGLVASYIAATLKARVALIEKDKMGGDCLNTGCVPSKAFIRSAKVVAYTQKASKYGLKSLRAEFEFSDIMDRVQKVIQRIEPHDSIERYTKLGVDCYQGEAKLISPHKVQINHEVLWGKAIILATGAEPFVPPFPGLEHISYLTSDNLWNLRQLPQRLLVLGGGPIGCELAQSFQRLGSQVTLVERSPRIMSKEDPDTSSIIQKTFLKEGINLLTEHSAIKFKTHHHQKLLVVEKDHQKKEIEFDEVLIALGRKARVKGFGLEELGIQLTPQGTIQTDAFLRTNYPHIFVCGDAAGPYQFTHTAAHQAYYATVNALFRPFLSLIPPPWNKSFKVDYSVIPWATYTDPEVATVGLTETLAQQKNIPYEVTTYDLSDLDRAITDGEDEGFIKVLTPPKKDKILGATIVHARASDLISELVLAMKYGLGLNAILSTIHIYPTLSEGNKFLAGNWKKARKPERLLKFLEKFHHWKL